ncbi:hypothetical protein D1007_37843 [Hordeum vulgare]|nr:hypothetical protein D1007_37843 [Hordeum vulgare]
MGQEFSEFLYRVLPGTSGSLYGYHDEYRSCYHTYKIDDAYVKYYAEISKKIKEYITELKMDASLKDIDLVYFEIWRLVTKGNVSSLLHQNIYSIVLDGGIKPTHKSMNRAHYAKKKVEIADQLKLDKKGGFVPFRPYD